MSSHGVVAVDARERLAHDANTSGFGSSALVLVAQATIPGYSPGVRLDDHQVASVRCALEVICEAGWTPASLPERIACAKAQNGENWAARFWDACFCDAAAREALSATPATSH